MRKRTHAPKKHVSVPFYSCCNHTNTHTHTCSKTSRKSLERENNNLSYIMYRKKIKDIQHPEATWKVKLAELELLVI